MHITFALIVGLYCGHTWPQTVGLGITTGALLAVIVCGYVDRSPDEISDLLREYCETFIVYLFLPSVVGALIGALWLVLGS